LLSFALAVILKADLAAVVSDGVHERIQDQVRVGNTYYIEDEKAKSTQHSTRNGGTLCVPGALEPAYLPCPSDETKNNSGIAMDIKIFIF
jgi:hypothetical protein